MLFNILKSELRFFNPFQNAGATNKGGVGNFEVFPDNLLWLGEIFKSSFEGLTPHQTCVKISWRSVKGWLRSIV